MDGCATDGPQLASTELKRRPFHLLRWLGNDVDDAVKCVKAVHRRCGPLNHFNPFYLRQGDGQQFPKHGTLYVYIG
ncbi:MAG: hypothetical protein JW384_01329 [Nitrosomonadaceae bacterium]|nr:hypothetical protein [Nitrosomonadaceae bacterium]